MLIALVGRWIDKKNTGGGVRAEEAEEKEERGWEEEEGEG